MNSATARPPPPRVGFIGRWLVIGLSAITLLAPCAQAATNLISEQAWVEDASGTMSLADIQQQPEQQFSGLLNRGYGKAPLWIRLRVDPTQTDEKLYLSIRPSYLDSVTLYDPLQKGAPNQRSGDRVALSPELPLSPMLLFSLPNNPTPRDIWLKMETTSARIGHFAVSDLRALMEQTTTLETMGGLFLGSILALLIWASVLLIGERNRLNITYLFVQILAFIYAVSALGFARLWFDGKLVKNFFLDYLLSYSAIIYGFGGIVFTYVLFQDYKLSKLATVWMRLLIVTPFASLLFLLFDNVRVAMQLNSALIIFVPLSFLVLSYLVKPEPKKNTGTRTSLTLLRLYCWLSTCFIATNGATLLGLVPAPPLFTAFATVPYALISGLSTLLLLQYRNKMLRRSAQQLQFDVVLTQEKAAHEAQHRRENEQLLSMLGHEMKTPLATIKMLMGAHEVPEVFRRKATGMINTMADLLERTTHASDLEGGALTVHVAACDLLPIVDQVRAASAEPERIQITSVADSILLETDPFLLEIVVKNLIDNALKYSPTDTSIYVTINQDHDLTISIEVSNLPGQAGFPDATQLFQKYYRSPHARHKSGSGLGLYLSHKLAQALGADLDYVPSDQAVKFRLTLRQHGAVSD